VLPYAYATYLYWAVRSTAPPDSPYCSGIQTNRAVGRTTAFHHSVVFWLLDLATSGGDLRLLLVSRRRIARFYRAVADASARYDLERSFALHELRILCGLILPFSLVNSLTYGLQTLYSFYYAQTTTDDSVEEEAFMKESTNAVSSPRNQHPVVRFLASGPHHGHLRPLPPARRLPPTARHRGDQRVDQTGGPHGRVLPPVPAHDRLIGGFVYGLIDLYSRSSERAPIACCKWPAATINSFSCTNSKRDSTRRRTRIWRAIRSEKKRSDSFRTHMLLRID
jgi:hypothetical protein